MLTELASQESIERVVGFLLKAAIHENMNDLPLLLLLQSKPAEQRRRGVRDLSGEHVLPGSQKEQRRGGGSHKTGIAGRPVLVPGYSAFDAHNGKLISDLLRSIL